MFLYLTVFNSLSPSPYLFFTMHVLPGACLLVSDFKIPLVRSLFRHHLLWPTQAHPRNLPGSDGRLRKNKRKKTNMQKAGVRWAGHSDGDTQQLCPPPVSLLYIVANKEVEQQFWGT
jgi:hypothetical protein